MKFLCSLFVLQIAASLCFAQVKVDGLLCENRTNPLGMDVIQPRFTWQISSDKRNVMQSAYRIEVSESATFHGHVWDSQKVKSDSSVFVTYKGKPLQSDKKYFWRVQVWDNTGKSSGWSQTAWWQMALLSESDWKAQWITPGYVEDSISRPSPMMRKEFALSKKIKSAVAYITAHGLYEANINGKRVGDAYLTPGWTSYKNRLQYQSYDVTDMLKDGKNAIGVMLGNGWYRGIIGYSDKKNVYGKDIALLMQINVTYEDGTTGLITSDESWKSSTGEIVYSEIYNGETIDHNKVQSGWTQPGFNDSQWSAVHAQDYSKKILIATYNEMIRKHETFKPVRIFKTPKNEQVIDFGQNLVGWVVLKIKGKAGDKITVSHAEVLDKLGNFYTENLRAAKAQDTYILKGSDEEIFEPHFTFHGFQFIRIEGYPGDIIKPEDVIAVALYSDMKPTGTFTTSNPLINQLQHNIQWGQKGNFLDVPTDCPQRDERLGWTGDAQVFSRTATFNMNVNDFFAKWLKDVAADQSPSGIVPFVIPNCLGMTQGSTGWGDVSTVIPWNMYLAYGDKRILQNQYGSMKAWVDYMQHQAKNDLWNTGFHFGDWLFYSRDDDTDGSSAITDKYFIAQCFYAYSTQLLINAAIVLNKQDDVTYYTALLKKIKDAFYKEYVTPNGRLVSGTQTAYTLALNFDMLPEALRTQAATRLVENIHAYGDHLTTGFLGTPYLCHVLTRFGKDDIAYKLLLQDTYPSWLYPVKMGATTIWERWDGIRPDKTFEAASMNSFNHYSYGAIGDWMYRVMAGMDTYPDGPGYKHIKIMPHPGGKFTQATANLLTYYGNLSSGWEVKDGKTYYTIDIPANTKADIYLPAKQAEDITEDDKALAMDKALVVGQYQDGYIGISVGSGVYHFAVINPIVTPQAPATK
ncbi:family 78 glycoside hydrolase catalytic domain [Mucilaginibacter sp. McL0603]|uniref:family 78 glycoside hydrolase catalytic domain n=1 Tax=Mucilaginibacter sp. McL0603 TaxID=3415670 RepID=UPI003CF0612C